MRPARKKPNAVAAGERFFVVVTCNIYRMVGREAVTSFDLLLKPIGDAAMDQWPIENCASPELNHAK